MFLSWAPLWSSFTLTMLTVHHGRATYLVLATERKQALLMSCTIITCRSIRVRFSLQSFGCNCCLKLAVTFLFMPKCLKRGVFFPHLRVWFRDDDKEVICLCKNARKTHAEVASNALPMDLWKGWSPPSVLERYIWSDIRPLPENPGMPS